MEEDQRRSDVLRDHLALALLDEEAGARLEIGGEGSRPAEEVLFSPDLVGGAGRDDSGLARALGGLVDGSDGDISHEQKGRQPWEEGELLLQEQ